MPKISIVVPIYNAEKYLERCIQSILVQTYSDFEVLLINDGSKDNSIKICQQYEKKDNRIKVIDKKNEGVSQTRNQGIKIARGKYIQFIDSDDFIEPNMLEEMLEKAEKEEVDVCICGFQYTYEKGDKNVNYQASEQVSYSSTEAYIEKFMIEHMRKSYPIASME